MSQKFRFSLSKLLDRCVIGYKSTLLTFFFITMTVSNVYAAQPKLVSGTVALFQAITGWLLLIIPVGAGAVLGYHALQKSLTDDQAIIAEKNKMMKNVIIGAAIAETASGLVTIILGFYS